MTTRVWVDIEDAAGQKLGDGPLISVTDWQQTARLDRAGDFAFRMPASDARAAECRPKRYARCWHVGPEGLKSLGHGRIERVELRETADGPLLDVSGVDLLGELADRLVRREGLKAEIREHPVSITGATTATGNSCEGMYDNQVGDTTSYARLECDDLATTPFVIAATHLFHKITFNLGASVNNTHTVTYQYGTSDGSWVTMTDVDDALVDGTAIVGKGLQQTGVVSFTPPSAWEPYTGEFQYKIRINAAGGDAAEEVDIQDLSITYWGPSITALDDIMAYAPTGWSLDGAQGYTTLQYRALTGTELLTDGGLESFTGTADDANSDNWDDWTEGVNGDAKILAMTTHAEGSYSVKLLTGSTTANYCAIMQAVAASPSTEYTVRFKSLGDGTNGALCRVFSDDGSSLIGDNAITNLLYSTNTSTTVWQDERYTFTTPADCTHVAVSFYSPIPIASYCLIDDVSLQAGGGNSIYLQCSDESVLEMLIRVAETTGEHFILSPSGRKVLWLGNDERTLALRAVSNVNAVEIAGEDTIAVITDLAEMEDTAGVVARVYPYGAGMGGGRVTLASATTLPPAGYTLSTANNYVERDAAVTALGVVETARSWADIVEQTDDTTAAAQSAANILLIQAVNWLSTHSCTSTDRLTGDVPRFYQLGLAKCEQMLLPGHKLRVVHHRWVDGYHAVSIDRDLWITAATWRVGPNGVETARLDVATVDRPAVNDALALATGIRRIVGLSAHNTAAGY